MRFSALFLGLLAATPALAELEEWTPVTIPQPEGWQDGPGFGWYRACVEVPAEWQGSRLLLMVDAISDVDEEPTLNVSTNASAPCNHAQYSVKKMYPLSVA